MTRLASVMATILRGLDPHRQEARAVELVPALLHVRSCHPRPLCDLGPAAARRPRSAPASVLRTGACHDERMEPDDVQFFLALEEQVWQAQVTGDAAAERELLQGDSRRGRRRVQRDSSAISTSWPTGRITESFALSEARLLRVWEDAVLLSYRADAQPRASRLRRLFFITRSGRSAGIGGGTPSARHPRRPLSPFAPEVPARWAEAQAGRPRRSFRLSARSPSPRARPCRARRRPGSPPCGRGSARKVPRISGARAAASAARRSGTHSRSPTAWCRRRGRADAPSPRTILGDGSARSGPPRRRGDPSCSGSRRVIVSRASIVLDPERIRRGRSRRRAPPALDQLMGDESAQPGG